MSSGNGLTLTVILALAGFGVTAGQTERGFEPNGWALFFWGAAVLVALWIWVVPWAAEKLRTQSSVEPLDLEPPPPSPAAPAEPEAPTPTPAVPPGYPQPVKTFKSVGGVGYIYDWERPHAEALANESKPLRVGLVLAPNIGSGVTQGVWLRVTNIDADAIRGAKLVLDDARRWSETHGQFVETEDSASFRGLTTNHSADLYCERPVDMGFCEAGDDSLRVDGMNANAQTHGRIRTPGLWRLSAHIVAGERTADVAACFKWEGKGVPTPVHCPGFAPIVSTAPEPHKPVGYY